MQNIIHPFGSITCQNKYMTIPIDYNNFDNNETFSQFLRELDIFLKDKELEETTK